MKMLANIYSMCMRRMPVIGLVFCIAFIINTGYGQPMAGEKVLIDNIEVYRDFEKPNLFYYGPGEIKLSTENDGKPRFQLLEMRYTGTSAYSDEDEKRFLNVVQFTVNMEKLDRTRLSKIKHKLGGSKITLRPLPVKNVESVLAVPVKDNKGEYVRVGKSGSFQAEGSYGKSSNAGYWTERTFTLKLENHEAQLIWNQVNSGNLAMSFGYAFYAEVLTGGIGEIMVSGNEEFVENMESDSEELLSADTVTSIQVIKSDAFPIRIDVDRWPELLKKLDINEEVPPAYAALEVKCYDFADDLRPDLALKTIEIQATGVGGGPVKLTSKKFLRGQPDLHTLQIKFPYAVKMNKPLRYKVTEYTLEGEKYEFDWVTRESWTELIDITTPVELNKVSKKQLEIETDPDDWVMDSIKQVDFIINYILNGKSFNLNGRFSMDESLPIKSLTFKHDSTSPVYCRSIWYRNDGEIFQSGIIEVEDDYLFLSPPEQ